MVTVVVLGMNSRIHGRPCVSGAGLTPGISCMCDI
ncbi:rCG24227 [Rattus norvegicus]|uniref:RCG24227 n=1 Tax=Rattus norvegicus TaxID=10116 RepID=A6KB11_RAT|nr:rCG24227 [Rattus norvegicus]